MKAIDKLKKYLPQFEWKQENKNSSIFGTLKATQVTKRINKNMYWLNNVHVFISSKMGGTIDNPTFRYAMCYQAGKMRPYRHKIISGVEYNKLFVSAKDLDSIVNELIKNIDLDRYFLSK